MTIALLVGAAKAVSIAEINGNRFLSPYSGQSLTNISGLVTAKSSSGVFIRSLAPDDDAATSESVFVFGSAVASSLAVGHVISLDAKVSEYRSSSSYLYLTELSSPTNVHVLSQNNTVTPLVIGKDTSNPPTTQYTSLDGGDVYALPNHVANVSSSNPVLDPLSFGLDFWESLSGELVTIQNVTVVSRPNSYGEFWITGGWPATGRSSRGSLTMSDLDSNPETIIVGDPLDGTSNPSSPKIGDQAADVTGVVYYEYGFYYLLPTTALTLTTLAEGRAEATALRSTRTCEGITVGDYNVENLEPGSARIPSLADHIVNFLGAPDLMFVQEIQDDSGAADDGVVSGELTLASLVGAVAAIGNVTYSYVEIPPVDGQDGGAPGGNIRVAYLYRPEVLSLHEPNPGDSTAAAEVVLAESSGSGSGRGPGLSLNPGRVDPGSAAWDATRKPLAAAWVAVGATKPFFTVNVHHSSKGGGSSLQGDPRPPVNGVVDKRVLQANVTGVSTYLPTYLPIYHRPRGPVPFETWCSHGGSSPLTVSQSFISQILALDPEAAIIAAGDFNEFAFVEPLTSFAAISGLTDLDEVVGTPVEERYTYTYDMNTQALDHIYVSPALADGVGYEHVHVNTWATSEDSISDHDPSVARFNVCG